METPPKPAVAQLTAKIPDGGISYLKWTSDTTQSPSVVFLHANGFNGRTYTKILEGVSREHVVYAPDFRGHGFTTLQANPEMLTGWFQYRDDIISFIDTLEETGPFVLAGHSMGGATACLVAAERPELVSCLVVFEPVMVKKGIRAVYQYLARMGFKRFENPLAKGAERRRVHYPDRETIFNSYKGRGAFTHWPNDMIWDYIYGGTRERSDGSVELCCSGKWEAANYRMAGFPIFETFANIKCPVRLIHGTYNSSTPADLVAKLKSRHQNISTQHLQESTHFVPMEETQMARHEILTSIRKYVPREA